MKYLTWTVFLIILMSNVIHASPNITGAEYFIDIDPGEGNAYPLAVTISDCSYTRVCADVNFNFDTSKLSIGYHLLYIRMKNENNIWGITKKYPFVVEGQKGIVAGEYFIDNDPGVGKATPVKVGGNQLELSEIDTSSLSIGLHTLFVRMKNSDNVWGPVRKKIFEVSPPSIIEEAEYFINYDSGVSKGESLKPSDGTFDEDTEELEGDLETVDLSSDITHTVYIRAKDNYERWGKTLNKSFYVKNPIPKISGRIFTSIAGWENLEVRRASVSLIGEETSVVFTNDDGYFSFKNLPANNYTLSINSPDFKTVSKIFSWSGEDNLNFDIKLELLKYSDNNCNCEVPYDNGILLFDNFDTDNNGEGQINYYSLKNWNVTDGMIDLIGYKYYLDGRFDFLPGNGLYLDMDGTKDNNGSIKAGTITSKDIFKLYPGEYLLEFNLAGCQRNDDDINAITVSLGSLYSKRIVLENDVEFKLFTEFIHVVQTTEAHLVFSHSGGDEYGLLLDNIKFLSLNGRNGCGLLGDFNDDGVIDLKEVIRALKKISGF